MLLGAGFCFLHWLVLRAHQCKQRRPCNFFFHFPIAIPWKLLALIISCLSSASRMWICLQVLSCEVFKGLTSTYSTSKSKNKGPNFSRLHHAPTFPFSLFLLACDSGSAFGFLDFSVSRFSPISYFFHIAFPLAQSNTFRVLRLKLSRRTNVIAVYKREFVFCYDCDSWHGCTI